MLDIVLYFISKLTFGRFVSITDVMFLKELFFYSNKNYSVMYLQLHVLESFKARILMIIITWSEMGQQTPMLKSSINEKSFISFKTDLYRQS